MIHAQNKKHVSLTTPATITTDGLSGTVDVAGWDYAEVIVHLDTQAASSTVTFSLTEGDVATTLATHADLVLTTVAPQTNTPDIYKWMLDLRKRKRYLSLTITPVTAVVAAAHVVLSRGEQAPTTAAARGLTAQKVS